MDLLCNTYTPNWMHPYPYIEIPKSQYTRNTETVPANPLNKLVFKISNISGYYDVDKKWTSFNFSVDALTSPGHAVEVSVLYDFNVGEKEYIITIREMDLSIVKNSLEKLL